MPRPARTTFMLSLAITACGGGSPERPDATPLPTSVACGDVEQYRQRAADDRQQSDALTSDQERISVGNRANFYASLAIIAELRCKETRADTDSLLGGAFAAARRAHESTRMYVKAFEWGRADFLAMQAIALMLSAPPDSVAR